MEFVDIVDFEFSNPQEYGFSKALRIGKDIFVYDAINKNPKSPSILAVRDKNNLIHNLRNYDFVYLPNYDADIEIITSVVKKNKRFIVSLSDILEKKGIDKAVALYKIRKFIKFCISYNADFVIASFAKSIYSTRTPKEVESISLLLDILPQRAVSAMGLANYVL